MSENEKKSKPSKNRTQTFNSISFIHLQDGKRVMVDTEDLTGLTKYKWRAVKASRLHYAKTTVGKPPHQVDLSMHRLIARTPKNQVCHHKNRNSLDNRRCNLENMDPKEHELFHQHNNLIVKFKSTDQKTTCPSISNEGAS